MKSFKSLKNDAHHLAVARGLPDSRTFRMWLETEALYNIFATEVARFNAEVSSLEARIAALEHPQEE